jgi:hypothetical protein
MDQASLKACNTSLVSENVTSEPERSLVNDDRSEMKISPEQGSVLFNGMVHPFIRTTIYGAIW